MPYSRNSQANIQRIPLFAQLSIAHLRLEDVYMKRKLHEHIKIVHMVKKKNIPGFMPTNVDNLAQL